MTITGLGTWICVMLSVAFTSVLSAGDGQSVADPSLVPLVGSDGNPAARYRAYGDINKDGFEDLIVSENVEAMSQNGLNLFMYWGDSSGGYRFYDTVYTSPKRLKFEIDLTGIRLWTYWHMSAARGILGYTHITDSGVVPGDNIEVFGGDGGGSISRAVVDAYFNTSDVSLRIEQYRIVNGVVEIVKP